MRRQAILLLALASSLLAGCDMIGDALGIESPERIAAAREADGKAIGGACRNAARAIEDCFALNRKADKAAMLAGWREMNDYMRENKIDPIAPQVATQVAGAKPDTDGTDDPDKAAASDDKPAAKSPGGKARAREGRKAHDS
jgi:hypothetical protein